MRHLKVHHQYTSLKMKFKEEFPQLNSCKPSNDGFGHMKKAVEDDLEILDGEQGVTRPDDNEKILLLQQQLSEANIAREQQVHEIARLKSSITKQEESMKVGINKSNNGQINIRANNFIYDEESDTLQVLDDVALNRELEEHCTSLEKDKEKKLS